MISGCSQQIAKPSITKTFQVKYNASYSSSAGTRTLDITYTVKNGEIIDCKGNYVMAMTSGTTTYKCELEKLKAKEYNVPLELITEFSEDKKIEEIRKGPGEYRWEILE